MAEVKPNEIVNFNVKMHVPQNSTVGTRSLEVYVRSNELMEPKSEAGVLKVGKVDYTMYIIYGAIIAVIIVIVAARKFLVHKEKEVVKVLLVQWVQKDQWGLVDVRVIMVQKVLKVRMGREDHVVLLENRVLQVPKVQEVPQVVMDLQVQKVMKEVLEQIKSIVEQVIKL
jgi:hypothetical protein